MTLMAQRLAVEKIQRLAVENCVPAWSAMIDLRRTAREMTYRYELILMDMKGIIFSIEETSHNAWDRLEAELQKYALTEDCQKDWQRYQADGGSAVGTFGAHTQYLILNT